MLAINKKGLQPFALVIAILVTSSCNQSMEVDAGKVSIPQKVDFNFHIRPILSDKCFTCHGPDANKRKADLRLDTKEGAFAALKDDTTHFAIVSGKPNESEVYLRINSGDTSQLMPPPSSNLKLTDNEIKLIRKWIKQGAEYKPHWAFVPPESLPLPKIKDKEWPKNEIDYFILHKLEALGLSCNERADKERLLKRVSFDLTGLPPTIALQEKFLKDDSPGAYEKVVDELLKNKHYGEKMAIHWLDVARYADSHGYQDDGLRTMWPWRDWVIHAFNENYSYDKFLIWQLAGDLVANKNMESVLATGFNRNHKITQEGGVIDEEYRIEYVTDRTNTFGKAFLGLTFECAKCHDHKYDPISQKDYFSTFAFFDKVPEKGLFGTIDASFADPPNITITDEDIREVLTFINKKDSVPVSVMVMKDSVGIRNTHLLKRGNYDAKAEIVDFATPQQILEFDTSRFEQNRLGLAKWLLDNKNPLTTRVFVNRIWQEIFGRGIVRTSGDFGMQGDLPTHPELLDWLAVDFRDNGWDIKRLVKKIVTSATYMQSSVVVKEKLERDPENIYLSRMGRSRLSAETVRDHVLASSGLLNPEIGGPSVKPYQPDGIWAASTSGRGLLQKYIQDHGGDLYRRGIYTFIKRTAPPPVMLMFDASPRDQCEVRRLTTNTPLQALVMLNDPTVLEASRILAEKLIEENSDTQEKLKKAFRLILCREPKEKETQLLTSYFNEEVNRFSNEKNKAKSFVDVGEFPAKEIKNEIEFSALMQVIHTVYNMEETITKS
ncbi:PSD1 and planctomycete cytochrome C domain-containing protein [Fulvivirgaceae bacterium BMA10]|uniref:PSD1 and planctomycete cytochrome C domain-containing protein n=1 Tax=Splendidivirga corallicola TaxID=3051826 RepID=A0ABT8KMR0_9BACT|nr:PSD1 and planctomycete cytochrome C domain-containing protein [Fulvivirgaceae bacterium BMA10]